MLPLTVVQFDQLLDRGGILRLFVSFPEGDQPWKAQSITRLTPDFPRLCIGERVISSASTSRTSCGSTHTLGSGSRETRAGRGLTSSTFVARPAPSPCSS